MVLTIAPSTTTAEAPACQNQELNPALYGKSVKYRARLKNRVDYLELGTHQHEIPIAEGADLRMPALLKNRLDRKEHHRARKLYSCGRLASKTSSLSGVGAETDGEYMSLRISILDAHRR
jgi:hypothetical protein